MLDSTSTTARSVALPAATRLGTVELTVTDLDRSLAFYERSLGLVTQRRDGDVAALGTGGDELLVLVARPDARPPGRHAGLYHVALLHPSRLELARAAARLALTRTPIDGASDHGISEAIYLPDPDGNGIELAADRPREAWPDLSAITGGPAPLDLRGLVGLLDGPPTANAHPDVTVGHVHLHVGDLEAARQFYCDVLGFELMTRLPSAIFVAAGGYHHHVGLNTWRGEGVPPTPPGTIGLRHYTVLLPDAEELERVHARLVAAGAPVERTPEGVFAADPAGSRLALRIEETRRAR
jgi:catechol 2,3-dioxygenase